MIQFDLPEERSSIIKVVGIGGGGCNAVNHMCRQGIRDVNFVICNTDAQALESSPVPNKIQLGPELTSGRGAGSHPEVGRDATLESVLDIKEIFSESTEMVFITAGMGGGTGTGGAPVVAKIARELGILTVGIVTMPFGFEGKRRIAQAHKGIEELKEHVDSLLVIVNDKIREVYGNLGFSEAFSMADNILATAAKGIAEIITIPGYVNVDFEDVKTVLHRSGVAIMGTGVASGEDRAIQAVENALNSPLLNDTDIRGARHVLLNITSGAQEVRMDEISEITEYVQDAAGHDSDIIWGNCRDENLDDQLAVTVIATGFDSKHEPSKKEDEIVVHELEKREPEIFPAAQEDQSMEPVLKTIDPQPEPKQEIKPVLPKPVQEPVRVQPKPQARPEVQTETRSESSSKHTPPAQNAKPKVFYLDEEPQAPKYQEPEAHVVEPAQVDAELNVVPEEPESNEETASDYSIEFEINAPAELESVDRGLQAPVGDSEEVDWNPELADELGSAPQNFEADNPVADFAPELPESNSTPQAEAAGAGADFSEEAAAPVAPKGGKRLKVRTVYPDLDKPAQPVSPLPAPVNPEKFSDRNVQRTAPQEFTQPVQQDFQPMPQNPAAPANPAVEATPVQAPAQAPVQGQAMGIQAQNTLASDDEEMRRRNDERRRRLRHMSMKFNVEELEKTPAYMRRNVDLTTPPHSSDDHVSRYELGEGSDPEDTGLRRKNTFLHDNVD